VKSGRKNLPNVSPRGRVPDDGPEDCKANALTVDAHLSTRKIAKALNISSTTVGNLLTKSLGMKCDHVP
jgi:hypothetical protein